MLQTTTTKRGANHYRTKHAEQHPHRRSSRDAKAYAKGLQERLQETQHALLKSITQAQNEPNNTNNLTPLILKHTRRAKRLQALLDATTTRH